MPQTGQDLTLRDGVAAELIRDDLARLVFATDQQAFAETLGGCGVRRSWTRMSNTTPCWSTARQR